MSRSTFLGLLVLAFVAAGVYWARPRPAPSTPASTVQTLSGDALPDVTVADASVDAGDVRITLSLTPRPPVAFAKFRVRVSAFGPAPIASSSAGAAAAWPLAIDGGRVSFEMTMPMGDHRYSLVPAERAGYEAEVVLPLCMSGNRRWYATVEGTAAGQPVKARFRLDLTKPASPPTP